MNSWVLFWVPGIQVCLVSRVGAVDAKPMMVDAARARLRIETILSVSEMGLY